MGDPMTNATDTSENTITNEEAQADEALRRMIAFTKREAEKDGRTFCAYLLDMAYNALNEDNPEMNMALRAKITPLPLGDDPNKKDG